MSGFPGFNAAQAPQTSAPAGPFKIEIPADPTWEPMEFGDILDMDGAFAFVVTGEKPKEGEKPGIWLTGTIQDQDYGGKKLQKFLPDPRVQEKMMFLWRGLFMSIWGTKEAARQAVSYTPGVLSGATFYAKTEAYLDDKGEQRTGLGAFLTKTEYDALVLEKKHRWPAVARGSRNAGAPAGLPAGFPGFPGAPVPQPSGAPPVQTAPPAPQPSAPSFPTPPAPQVPPPPVAPLAPPTAAPAFPQFPGFPRK